MTHKMRDDDAAGGWLEVPPTNVTEPEIIEVNMDESIFNTCVAACASRCPSACLTAARCERNDDYAGGWCDPARPQMRPKSWGDW